jgi:hypothetical protein
MDSAQKVVARSLKTKSMAAADKVLPDALKAEQHRKMAEPGSGVLTHVNEPRCPEPRRRWDGRRLRGVVNAATVVALVLANSPWSRGTPSSRTPRSDRSCSTVAG